MLALFAALRELSHSLDRERGGVVVEYGIVVVTIAVALAVVGGVFVAAVQGWFGDIAALFPL